MLIYTQSILVGQRTVVSHTQACSIIHVRVGEMKITMELPVVELHSHGVMGLLVHRPHSTGQVQA